MKDVKAALSTIDKIVQDGPFDATWRSLEDYQIPKWYKDEKFGIFIHWGLYCVPAFGSEWYPRNMYEQDSAVFKHHRETYGNHTEFGYKDFIPMFKAENFDPDAWAELFANAGARFVVPVAEHHDGFPMYDCGFTEWDAAKMGPCRDIIGDLGAAVREKGMLYGLSSHRAEHWWFFDGGMKFDSDVQDPQWAGLYGPARPKETQPDQEYLDDWLVRTCEIVDKYQPQIVWFDWWIEEPAFTPYLKRFAAYYYNRGAEWGKGVAINYKNRAYPDGTAVFDVERGQLSSIHPLLWQTDTSVSKNSWGYIDNHDYKTAGAIVGDLVDIVSKNGALLLNIGPRADGTIPDPEKEMLLDIGKWFAVNGEAIYGTRPWRVFGEGPTEVAAGSFTDTKRSSFTHEDIRFTVTDDAFYAITLAWPTDGKLTIKNLKTDSINGPLEISRVELLGCEAPLEWTRDSEGLHIDVPSEKPCDHAFCFKVV